MIFRRTITSNILEVFIYKFNSCIRNILHFCTVVDSFNGIYASFFLFTKSNIKPKVYEPTYKMGDSGI